MPPRLTSNVPRWSPSCASTTSRRKPLGGRCASAMRASSRTRRSSRRGGASDSSTVSPMPTPATVRPSNSTDEAITTCSCPGSAIQLLERGAPGVRGPGEQRPVRAHAVLVGGQAAGVEARHDPRARGRRPSARVCGSASSPCQTSPVSASEERTASRRPRLPSASHDTGAGAGPRSGDRQLDEAPRRPRRGRSRRRRRSAWARALRRTARPRRPGSCRAASATRLRRSARQPRRGAGGTAVAPRSRAGRGRRARRGRGPSRRRRARGAHRGRAARAARRRRAAPARR